MTLTKDAIISAVGESNGYPRTKAVELVETLIELIKSRLSDWEDVLISGFGKFCVKKKRERRGRNPATGEDMMLESRRVVTFKWSGQLSNKINKSHYYFNWLILRTIKKYILNMSMQMVNK